MKRLRSRGDTLMIVTRCCWMAPFVFLTGCVSPGDSADRAAEPVTREQWESRVPKNSRGTAFAFVEEDPALPRVLLIGDSISIGYTPEVRRLLAGQANVLRIPANAGPTTRGLESIVAWLGGQHWDVIHFNWGLHDLKRLKDGKMDASGEWQVGPKQYRENLRTLVWVLKRTGAKLVWASTTPVPRGASGRIPGDDVRYNAIAAKIMKRRGVVTNDLYAAVVDELAAYQRPANVHSSEEGSAFLGERVAASICDALDL